MNFRKEVLRNEDFDFNEKLDNIISNLTEINKQELTILDNN